MNPYQMFLNITVDWIKVGNSIIAWFNTPLWTNGPAPIMLFTFYGLSLLISIFVLHLVL